jgi:hypothetical protein
MSPVDPYFTSKPISLIKENKELIARWKSFQRLSHSLQAEEIDEILRKAKEGPLDDWEFYVLQMWESKRNPVLS